jgi:pyruvate dehydrogenase E1 component alpha subunit
MRRLERETPTPAERTQLAELYRQMLSIRRMEEAAAKAYAQGKIGGFLHLYIGQESVAVGANAAIRPDDYMVATYREHGHAYTKGASARSILA